VVKKGPDIDFTITGNDEPFPGEPITRFTKNPSPAKAFRHLTLLLLSAEESLRTSQRLPLVSILFIKGGSRSTPAVASKTARAMGRTMEMEVALE